MNTRRMLIGFVVLAVSALSAAGYLYLRRGTQPITDLPGPVAPDFTLLDHQGRAQTLHREAGARAIVIIGQGNDCPIVQKYSLRIRELAAQFEERGVPFFMINANTQDTRQAVIKEAEKFDFGVPILLDPSQAVTQALGIERTGEAVIINPATWKIVYRGAIDDRLAYGADKQVARNNYLNDALEDLLAGRKIASPPAPAKGCAFSFPDPAAFTYSQHVAPILREKCLNCHSAEARYPPFFDSYKTVKGWSAMIRETLLTDRMPPWSADPLYGHYSNDISLTPQQKQILFSWIGQGSPRGSGEDPLEKAPAPKREEKLPPKVWEVQMKTPTKISPRGTVEYQFLEVGGPAPYDMWVTAYRTTTTNPAQLHHEAMMITSKPLSFYESQLKEVRDPALVEKHPDGDVPLWTMMILRRNDGEKNENYLRFGVWAAGRPQPNFLPLKTAVFIPKGYYAILEVHYVGNGKEDEEQTKVEFFGYREKKDLRQLRTVQVVNTKFVVPAGERRFEVQTRSHLVKRDMVVTSFLSHMHMRGRAVRLEIEEPGTARRVLASIPNFDYNWQTGFPLTLAKPLKIKKGSRIMAVCEYDNSPWNPFNPDPSRSVNHGQTLDRTEMCKFMLSYYHDN